MEIFVNNEALRFEAPLSLAALLEHLHLTAKRIAVEVDREIVPRSQYAAHQLSGGERIEIVHAIGGG